MGVIIPILINSWIIGIKDMKKIKYSNAKQKRYAFLCDTCMLPSVYNARTDTVECISCGINMNYVNIGITRDEVLNPIDKVGVELEGFWNKYPAGSTNGDVVWHDDGSVEFDDDGSGRDCTCPCTCGESDDDYCRYCDEGCDHDCDGYHDSQGSGAGEYVTRPVPYKQWNKMVKILDENYPSATNDSCGGHVHFSPKNKIIYQIFMNEDFWYGLKEHLRRWAIRNLNENGIEKMKSRLAGEGSYCHNRFTPEEQFEGGNDRYTHINYDYKKYGTIEIRLLPMFDQKELYIKAVKDMLDFVVNWIQKELVSITNPRVDILRADMKGVIKTKEMKTYEEKRIQRKKRILVI